MKGPSKIIALEEAFWTPETKSFYSESTINALERTSGGRLGDVGEARIRRMDQAGIDVQVLSQVSPGPQGLSAEEGHKLARISNDFLARQTRAFPKRFKAFAALPTHDANVAAQELERTVKDHGFCGGLINGATQGQYLDQERCWPIFERAESLNVPIYIHPATLPEAIMNTYFKEYPELSGAAWGWGVDTGTHLLRIICSGVLDKYPKTKLIVGHMGELIPFHFHRIERWINFSATRKMKKRFADYMRENVFITTSGVFDYASLQCAISTLGVDNILFSVDDPFEVCCPSSFDRVSVRI